MTQYIDKDALVAEIERRINEINLDSIEDWRYRLQREHDIEVMKKILSLIDTIEVKEVNSLSLTWEDMLIIHKCIKDATNYHLSAFQTVEGQQKIYEDVLKRFKAQKE